MLLEDIKLEKENIKVYIVDNSTYDKFYCVNKGYDGLLTRLSYFSGVYFGK